MTTDADEKRRPTGSLSLEAMRAAAYKGDGGRTLRDPFHMQFVGLPSSSSSSSSSGHGVTKDKVLNVVNAPGYFFQGSVPSLADFGADRTYLTINAAELCSTLLVDDRRGRPEANHLMLLMVRRRYATIPSHHNSYTTMCSHAYCNLHQSTDSSPYPILDLII